MESRTRPTRLLSSLLLILMLALASCGTQGDTAGGTGAGGANQATTAAGGGAATAAAGDTGAAAGGAATTTAGGGDPTGGAQGDATINISLQAEPPKLDPATSSAFVDRQVLNSIMDKLVDLNPEGEIVPMLAKEWQVSDDQLTYTFTLQEGVKFHDGTDFDAEAVKFNLERGMAEASPRRTELSAVSAIEVVDPQTVKVTLKEPFAPFLSVLTDRAGMIVSPTAAKEMGEDFLSKPVGSGPFKFQERVMGSTITLVRNDDYWQEGLPKAKQIVYKIFTDANTALVNLRSGQVDITDSLPSKEVPALKSNPEFVVVNEPGLGYQGVWLNTEAPPLDKKEVRQAISMLINRDALVKVMFGETATPGNSPFSPSNLAYGESDKYNPPNVEEAKALLAKAGVPNPSFTLMTGTSPANAQFAQLIQGFLQPAGINMQIEKVEFGTMLDQMENGNFQAGALGWSGRPDPDQNIYNFFLTGASNNDANYSNPKVDELLNEARRDGDEAKRKALYDQVMQILHEDVPYVYIYHSNNVFGLKANVIGFTYVPDGIIRTYTLNKQ